MIRSDCFCAIPKMLKSYAVNFLLYNKPQFNYHSLLVVFNPFKKAAITQKINKP